jgi:WhiB family redox-sensing transcriptional regulator
MTELSDWRNGAACAEIDGDLWFPEKGEAYKASNAVKVCNSCPVKKQCLAYAVNNGIRDGIFGGKSAEQRARMKNPKRGAA